ncbi:hypothetical protein C1645_825747 [Glomus cerebriforme]|uniref:Uncharacterized protein n=1 Tax=Glomus cerebriforme TaxID=658196 RepID=A0A397SW06_9GLOM|nr:hypothetical protein C1645_825747 [Glomus cerebriforme]
MQHHYQYYRSSISYDNITNLSNILANLLNKYADYKIIYWCQQNHVIAKESTNILNPQDQDFQRFVDAVTDWNIVPNHPTEITLVSNFQDYQQFLPNELINFMKFILGLTYLLDNLEYPEDVYPFIGITYFVYNKLDQSSFLNPNIKALILQDIRNLWTKLIFKKTESHINLKDEWNVLIRETKHWVFPNPRRVNLTPVFNIITRNQSRTVVPLSVYIQGALYRVLFLLN